MATEALERIRSEVLELTEAERAELAHDLIASLDEPRESGVEDAGSGRHYTGFLWLIQGRRNFWTAKNLDRRCERDTRTSNEKSKDTPGSCR